MNINEQILKRIKEEGRVTSAQLMRATGFSREYVGRFLRQLQQEGRIVLIGKANQARYVIASPQNINNAKRSILQKRLVLRNVGLSEDIVLEKLKQETGIWLELPKNVASILDYGFTEMLNNAIDHSRSNSITVKIKRQEDSIIFEIIDRGIGIFNNIMRQKKLKSKNEAIEDLMKGKQTTMPKAHSGEGIFFSSKVADILIIQSDDKRLEFNNIVHDIFVKSNARSVRGTRIVFHLALQTKKKLNVVFRKYSDDTLSFSKTGITVKMFAGTSDYISRSQAKRLISGLEKFKTVILDFKNVETIGQAFVDEVFRVFKKRHPEISVKPVNMNNAVRFMIARVRNK